MVSWRASTAYGEGFKAVCLQHVTQQQHYYYCTGVAAWLHHTRLGMQVQNSHANIHLTLVGHIQRAVPSDRVVINLRVFSP